MSTDTKKIQLFEQLLRIDDNAILDEVQAILNKPNGKKTKPNIYDIVGMMSKEEVEEMERAIEETCEKVYPDDWK